MDELIGFSMIFTLIMVALVGGFILMYPITKRLGAYLERRIEDGSHGADPATLEAVQRALHDVRGQLDALEDRQDFLERLVEGRSPERLLTPERSGTSDGSP